MWLRNISIGLSWAKCSTVVTQPPQPVATAAPAARRAVAKPSAPRIQERINSIALHAALSLRLLACLQPGRRDKLCQFVFFHLLAVDIQL